MNRWQQMAKRQRVLALDDATMPVMNDEQRGAVVAVLANLLLAAAEESEQSNFHSEGSDE